MTWQPEQPDPAAEERMARLNTSGKLVDFGPALTNGAFRLLYKDTDWRLIPLPGSPSFHVELRLDQLNADGRKIRDIMAENADGTIGSPVKFQSDGQAVQFDLGDKVFACRILFAK